MRIHVNRVFSLQEIRWSETLKHPNRESSMESLWNFRGICDQPNEAQTPFEISHTGSDDINRCFTNEICRVANLREVYRLRLDSISIDTTFRRRCRRENDQFGGFGFKGTGWGHHSRVSMDPSEFTIQGVADRILMQVIQDIVEQFMGSIKEQL